MQFTKTSTPTATTKTLRSGTSVGNLRTGTVKGMVKRPATPPTYVAAKGTPKRTNWQTIAAKRIARGG